MKDRRPGIGHESERERQQRIENAGIGSPEYFGEVFRLCTLNQVRDEWGFTDPSRVRAYASTVLDITPEELDRYQEGILGIPPREQLDEWSKKLHLQEDMRDDLIISAGYLPDVSELSPAQNQAQMRRAILEITEESRRHLGLSEIAGMYTIGLRMRVESIMGKLRRRE